MKIAVAPTVMGLELLMFRRVPPRSVVAAVGVVCLGVGMATVADAGLGATAAGVLVGIGATIVTGLYQIWAGARRPPAARHQSCRERCGVGGRGAAGSAAAAARIAGAPKPTNFLSPHADSSHLS